MDTNKEIEFFDRLEEKQGDYNVLGEGAYVRLLELFEELVIPLSGEKCLDLGCGTGAFTRRLLKFGLEVVGLDISPRSVERGNRQSAGEKYTVGDIFGTKLPDESADIIVYSGVLHHVDDPQARVSVLKEGFRILKPGGRLFAFDPNARSPSMWLYRDPRSPFYSKKGKTDNEVLLSRSSLRSQIVEAGFRNVRVMGTSGITFRYVESAAASTLLPLYNLYEQVIRFSPFENLLGTFLASYGIKELIQTNDSLN